MNDKTRNYLLQPWLLAGLLMGALAAPVAAVDWSHNTGDPVMGPSMWGTLDPTFLACGQGQQQSPVDISEAVTESNAPPLEFQYKESSLIIRNNGHVITVFYDWGSQMTVGNETYNLVELQFHTRSEHTYLGESHDMEVHLVHRNDLEQTAILALFLKVGQAPNPLMDAVFQNAPPSGVAQVAGVSINAMDLLSHASVPSGGGTDTTTTDPGGSTDVKSVRKEWKEKKKAFKEEWKGKKKSWKEQWKDAWKSMKASISELFGGNKAAAREARRDARDDYRDARESSKEAFREERKLARETFREARREAIKAARNGETVPTGDTSGGTSGGTDTSGSGLPQVGTYFSYMGSLTMPPCTEGVKWFVVPHLVDIPAHAMQKMQELVLGFPSYMESIENSRPVQALNQRQVTQHQP